MTEMIRAGQIISMIRAGASMLAFLSSLATGLERRQRCSNPGAFEVIIPHLNNSNN